MNKIFIHLFLTIFIVVFFGVLVYSPQMMFFILVGAGVLGFGIIFYLIAFDAINAYIEQRDYKVKSQKREEEFDARMKALWAKIGQSKDENV